MAVFASGNFSWKIPHHRGRCERSSEAQRFVEDSEEDSDDETVGFDQPPLDNLDNHDYPMIFCNL